MPSPSSKEIAWSLETPIRATKPWDLSKYLTGLCVLAADMFGAAQWSGRSRGGCHFPRTTPTDGISSSLAAVESSRWVRRRTW